MTTESMVKLWSNHNTTPMVMTDVRSKMEICLASCLFLVATIVCVCVCVGGGVVLILILLSIIYFLFSLEILSTKE